MNFMAWQAQSQMMNNMILSQNALSTMMKLPPVTIPSLNTERKPISPPVELLTSSTGLSKVKTFEVPKVEQFDLSFDPLKPNKEHITDIVNFVLQNVGRIDESTLSKYEKKYSQDGALHEVFSLLVNKYMSIVKTKEEMIKCIIRRAFKSMKNQIKKKYNIDAKAACKIICEKYFGISKEDFEKKALNPDDEEELLDDLLPFRKNSKNRTMNNSFLNQIFSSDEFKNDFETFISDLDDMLRSENERKSSKLVSQIEQLVKKKKITDLNNMKRIPWLGIWIEKTKSVAKEMMRNGQDLNFKAKKKRNDESMGQGKSSTPESDNSKDK